MIRKTRQREAILGILCGTKTHPTADRIFAEARKMLPKLSFATVYRNLNELVLAGAIQRIDAGDGKEHFDADVSPHGHLKCVRCGAVEDVRLPDALKVAIEAVNPAPYRLVYNGLCDRCKK